MRQRSLVVALAAIVVLCAGACSRVTIVTGTTLGLKATPGDGNARPPQVTLGYKRAETALVPTSGKKASRDPGGNDVADVDAFSTLSTFSLNTRWFGTTEVASFIATGHAARDIQAPASRFNQAFAPATIAGDLAPEVESRQDKIFAQTQALDEEQAAAVLSNAGLPVKANKTAKQSLQDYLIEADTDDELVLLEDAVASLQQ